MSEAKGLNPIFKNILNKKNPGVKITYFSYEKGEEDGKISLTGEAETRDDLVIFESRLKKELGDKQSCFSGFQFNQGKGFKFFFVIVCSK